MLEKHGIDNAQLGGQKFQLCMVVRYKVTPTRTGDICRCLLLVVTVRAGLPDLYAIMVCTTYLLMSSPKF